MEVVEFIYNEQPVDFEPTGKDNVMVNATQMAKIFGRDVQAFMRNENTKAFVTECLLNENSRLMGIKNEEDLVTSVKHIGTWMHRILALKFAAWLDPAFELWVFVTIDRIINHYFREQRDAMIEKITIGARKEARKQEILLLHPEIADYFELEEQEAKARNKGRAAINAQFKQLKLDFYPKPVKN